MPTGNLPAEGKKLWEEVYDKALKGSCKNNSDPKGCAAGSAWKAVANAGWKKDAKGNWHKSEVLSEFSLHIDRASYDKASNERRWRAAASDTDEDNRNDNMSLELYNDFIDHINKNDPVPEEFQSEWWKGGRPYLSVSHYPDFNGKVPGIADAVYVDGKYLKSKGTFLDTPLGRKCFEAVCSDLYGETKDRENKIRISIAFLDWKHQHKSNGYIYDRKESNSICPECLLEMIKGESEGKIFLRGQLIHLALTRVPVNPRTSMEVDKSMADKALTRKDDAASIVGDDLAEELEKDSELVGKSEALVIKSEDNLDKAIEDGIITPEEVANAPVVDETGTDDDGNPIEESEALDEADAKKECTDPKTGKVDPDCVAEKLGKAEEEDSEAVVEKATKKEADCSHPSSHYLVVEDASKPSTWHLRVKNCQGKPDHRLMGAAWAALHSGYRGNKYEGSNKSGALAKLKKMYSSENLETPAEKAEFIKSVIEELQANKSEEPITVTPAHPLDSIFETFRSKFDEIVASGEVESEKLQKIQEPFNQLGAGIVSVIRSSVKVQESTSPASKEQTDIVAALSQVMNPIAQKLDLVLTQLSSQPANKPTLPVPPRRSIPPEAVIKAAQEQPAVKSQTPNLRKVIEKTT